MPYITLEDYVKFQKQVAENSSLLYLLKTCLPIIEQHKEYESLFIAIDEALFKAENNR